MKRGKILALLAALCVSLWAASFPEKSPAVLDLPEAPPPPEAAPAEPAEDAAETESAENPPERTQWELEPDERLAEYDLRAIVEESGIIPVLQELNDSDWPVDADDVWPGLRMIDQQEGPLEDDPRARFTLMKNGLTATMLMIEHGGQRDYLLYAQGGAMDWFSLSDLDGDGYVEVLTDTVFNGTWGAGCHRVYRREAEGWRCIFNNDDLALDFTVSLSEGYRYTVRESAFRYEDTFVRKKELNDGSVLFFDDEGRPEEDILEYRLAGFFEFAPVDSDGDGVSEVFAGATPVYGWVDSLGKYWMLLRYHDSTGMLEPDRSALWVPDIPDDAALIEKEKDLPPPPPEPGTYTNPSYGRYEREYTRQLEPAWEAFLAGR